MKSARVSAAEYNAIQSGKRPLPVRPLTAAARTMAEARVAALKTSQGLSGGISAPGSGFHAADGYRRATRGRRQDLGGLYFRSKSEANYARYLEWLKGREEIQGWRYEPCTFWFEGVRRGCTSYTPDFYVLLWGGAPSYYVEVKPYMDPKSKTKLRRMTKYHPAVRIVVVDRAAMAEIAAKVGKMIPGWES